MKIKNQTLNWIIPKSKPMIPAIILISILGTLDSVCMVFVALQSKNVIDFAVARDIDKFIRSVIILVSILVVQYVFVMLYMKIAADSASKFALSIQKDIFKEVITMNYTDITSYHTGELLNRITSDTGIVTSSILAIIPTVVSFASGLVAALTALFIMEPYFALFCIVMGICAAIGAVFFGRILKKYTKECRKWSDKNNSFIMECIQNILVIKSFCNENSIIKNDGIIKDNTYKAHKKRNNLSIVASILGSMVFSFGYYAAVVWGAVGIIAGTLTYGNLIAMSQLVSQVQSPLKEISSVIPQYYSMLASAERIMRFITSEKDTAYNKENNTEFDSIVFENVTFSYDGEVNVLESMDVEFKKHNIIMLEGTSGIGKSTLLKLLLGIYKCSEGHIYIKNGSTKTELDNSFRKLFAYVPQGNMIISGSIKDNVVFYNEYIDDNRIEACLKCAELWDDVCNMDKGTQTIIGENGLGISEGQAQRLAIARALYYDAPILLFDEATSALDSVTEARILSNIKALNNKTCIFVTHKNAVSDIADVKVRIKNKKFLN